MHLPAFQPFRKMKIIENIERKVETKISLLDSIIMIRKSWDKVSKETIANCFTNSGLSVREPVIQEDIAAITQNENADDAHDDEDDDDDDENEESPPVAHPTIFEARAALNVIQTFCFTHDNDIGISALRSLDSEIENFFMKIFL